MDRIFERLSIGHLLSVLSPGMIALVALSFLFGSSLADALTSHMPNSSTMATSMTIVMAYGIGLLFLECANAGSQLYLGRLLESMAIPPKSWIHTFFRWSYLVVLALLFGIRLPRMKRSYVEAQIMMSEFNETISHTFEVDRVSSPFDRLELFRKLVSRENLAGAETILEYSTEVHSRLLFALSMSLVLTLISIGASVGFISELSTTMRVGALLPLAIATGLGSYLLRVVAARCWEVELLLVCSLTDGLAEEEHRSAILAR